MIFSRRPRRTVPKADPIKHKGSDNPLYQRSVATPEVIAFRKKILSIMGIIILGLVFALGVYGPWLTVQQISVRGTRLLDPVSVESTAKQYTQQWRWLILPNRNIWLLSKSAMANFLRQRIETRLAIESVTIEKTYPDQLTVMVAERVPKVRWSSQGNITTVDAQGIVIEPLNTETEEAGTLPLVTDENNNPADVNTEVVTPDVITAILQIDELLDSYQRPILTFYIPVPSCPAPPMEPIDEQAGEEEQSNTNMATTEATQAPESAFNANTSPEEPACNISTLQRQSVEIHVQLQDGPRLLFDRHQDIVEAAAIVDRVLTQPENQAVQYVDVRFGERVFIR